MAVSLVKKYGVVPSYVMPESFNTSATNGLASALADKERKDALALRRLAQAGDQEGLEKARKTFLNEIYLMVCHPLLVNRQRLLTQNTERHTRTTTWKRT